MKKTKKPILYHVLRFIIRLFYPTYKQINFSRVDGAANIYIANHAQSHGPFSMSYDLIEPKKIWAVGEMCNRKEVTKYAMEDFWRLKSKWIKWWYYCISVCFLAPIGSFLFRWGDTIPIYKDTRLKQAIRDTVYYMDTHSIVIFPENRNPYNRYLNMFEERFVDVARQFVKVNPKEVYFHPVYVCPAFKTLVFGEPILFNRLAPINEERNRIIALLQTRITALGDALEPHRIVPYINIKKSDYPISKEETK